MGTEHNKITIGNSTVTGVYLGSTPVKSVYVGMDRVYHNPYPGYTEISAIKSNGRSYIDTGVVGQSGISMEIHFKYLTLPSDGCVCGSRNGDTRFYLCHYYDKKLCMGYGPLITSSYSTEVDYAYIWTASLKSGEQKLTRGGVTVINNTSSTTYNTNKNLYIGCCNNGGTAQWFSKIQIYYCKIYQNGTLIRDFIPLYSKTQLVSGLYDKINNKFYACPKASDAWTDTVGV